MRKKLLLVEDDTVSATIIKNALGHYPADITTAGNGREALDILSEEDFPVILSDIRMPEMDGTELIKELKKRKQHPVIIVQSAVQEVSSVIEIMKEGVFDYILKPVNQQELLHKIDKAFEFAELRDLEKAMEKEREIRVNRELENRRSIEKIMTREFDKFDKELFSNLKTNFSQGAGFGGLLGLISLVKNSAIKHDDKYLIDASLMDLIVENAKMGESALEAFGEIESVLNENVDFDGRNAADLQALIAETAAELNELSLVKNQSIKVSEMQTDLSSVALKFSKRLMKKAVRELLINAMKFSPDDSSILILPTVKSGEYTLSVLNTPIAGTDGVTGIPAEYRKIIFEPFFRLTRVVDERFSTLDFGLGLTLVDKIVRRHNAKISASNVTDFLNMSGRSGLRVNFEIELPVG